MGAEQSQQASEEYQHDYMTAHVKGVSKELSPQKKPFQGHSAVGADSWMMQASKRAQEAVSGTPHRTFQGVPSSMGADSYLLQEMKKVKSQVAVGEEGYKPSVGADAWLMTRQKSYTTARESGVRNRFNLMPEKPKAQDLTSYETDFATAMKKNTQGARHCDWVGTTGKVTLDDYTVKFSKTVQAYNKPVIREGVCQGIKPQLPKEDWLRTGQKERAEAFAEAAVVRATPTPQVDNESYMMQHAKNQAIFNSPSKIPAAVASEEGAPVHHYDPAEAASVKMEKAPQTPQKPPGQGQKTHMGADTFMMNFSRTVAGFTPKLKSKEVSNKPPQEVTL